MAYEKSEASTPTTPARPAADYEAINESIIARRAARQAVKGLLKFLKRNARDHTKKGVRVEILNFVMQRNEEGAENGQEFSERMGFSESHTSRMVDKFQAELDSIINGQL